MTQKRSASLRWSALPLVVALATLAFGATTAAEEPAVLNAGTLTKYLDPLPVPPVMPMAGPNYYEIGAYEIQQQLHSQLPPTTVYGYGTSQENASYPGATIVVQKGVPIQIKWTNHLPPHHILSYAFDPTIPAAVTTTGIPITTHVHGGEQSPEADGGPMTWFTPDFAEVGHDWKEEVHTYVNTQLPATIWYHDHAFGYTRHNVYAGLAGYYIVTDPGNEPAGLPSGAYDLGLCIQDRMFTTDGQLWYPNEGETSIHPIWVPEFFGDAILVNGKVWPYLQVEPRKYRFRFLNGSQARFYSLALADRITSAPGPAFYQIATDGGYLSEPVLLNDPGDPHSLRLIIAPGERADVVIDFSGYAPGTEFLLRNTAKAPYPGGEAPNPQTSGQVMLFRVGTLNSPDTSILPAQLAAVTRLGNPTVTRTMTLNELQAEGAPIGALLNGMNYHDGGPTEFPVLGTTEMWEVVNMTADTHPIHLHLVQFQLLNRQKFNLKRYEKAFNQANPVLPTETYHPVAVDPYLKGKPVPADPNERGWKDTFRMNPGEVTRVLIRWAPQDESPAFAFDATAEPGYVWHCHILEHEENDMMRPFHVVAAGSSPLAAPFQVLPTDPAPVAPLSVPAVRMTAEGSILRFSLRNPGNVTLDLFNVAGQRVKSLASGWFEAGEHTVTWDGPGIGGARLGSGVYFAQLRSGGIHTTQKVVVAP